MLWFDNQAEEAANRKSGAHLRAKQLYHRAARDVESHPTVIRRQDILDLRARRQV